MQSGAEPLRDRKDWKTGEQFKKKNVNFEVEDTKGLAQKEEMLCGGYTAQRELTEDEMAMFRSVTGAGATVYTPLSVATQVVAGTNFKFWCRFEDKETNKSGHCWIVIYQPLQGDPELTSIETAE